MTEAEGVKAIIALQKLAGIDEPEEKAKKNWLHFSEYEKKNTLAAYNMLCDGR